MDNRPAKYKLKKEHPNLTFGNVYEEYFPYPNGFNAAVTGDDGEVIHVPRKEFFDFVPQEP